MVDDLSGLLSSLHTVRTQKAALERIEKTILASLKPLVDPKFDALPGEPLLSNGMVLTRTDGVSRTISGDLLLERGVSPDIVQYATKTVPYYQYRVKESK